MAYQAVLSKGILAGSFPRCRLHATKVAKSVTEQAVMEQPHQGDVVGLVNMLAALMAIQDTGWQ